MNPELLKGPVSTPGAPSFQQLPMMFVDQVLQAQTANQFVSSSTPHMSSAAGGSAASLAKPMSEPQQPHSSMSASVCGSLASSSIYNGLHRQASHLGDRRKDEESPAETKIDHKREDLIEVVHSPDPEMMEVSASQSQRVVPGGHGLVQPGCGVYD